MMIIIFFFFTAIMMIKLYDQIGPFGNHQSYRKTVSGILMDSHGYDAIIMYILTDYITIVSTLSHNL